jgi:hypothetical protein
MSWLSKAALTVFEKVVIPVATGALVAALNGTGRKEAAEKARARIIAAGKK